QESFYFNSFPALPSKFSLIHLNTHSFKHSSHKFDRIRELADVSACDAFCITETWISDNSCLSLYQIPGYSFFHLPRNFKMVGKSAGGGVGCFISNSWNSKALCSPELSDDLSAS